MLKTKSILAPIEESDGRRISVMSRHTLNDGITPDDRITSDKYDSHLTAFAPPLKLVGAYYKQRVDWTEFEMQYLEYLRTPKMREQVRSLAAESLETTITIMCIEETPDKCHRRLLAEECLTYQSGLQVLIE
ncbi:DUF488 domain-containing protein [Candidatus Woesearchaeota archaeon]|jgi:uncharacterized protein YeaO (DUF488 family)|nr:DUF488 domain-containing protein [Candidatus Woesearchaeota archaeon]